MNKNKITDALTGARVSLAGGYDAGVDLGREVARCYTESARIGSPCKEKLHWRASSLVSLADEILDMIGVDLCAFEASCDVPLDQLRHGALIALFNCVIESQTKREEKA